jgi:hypothetical protein
MLNDLINANIKQILNKQKLFLFLLKINNYGTKKETWRKAKAGRRKEKGSSILFKRKVSQQIY